MENLSKEQLERMLVSSYCGVKCESCKVFIALKNSDNILKLNVAICDDHSHAHILNK